MATYTEIQASVMEHDGFVPKTRWIADVKEEQGLSVRLHGTAEGQAERILVLWAGGRQSVARSSDLCNVSVALCDTRTGFRRTKSSLICAVSRFQ